MARISEVAIHFLLNAVWQVAAITAGAAICARLLRNAAPRHRHVLWVAALVLSFLLPLWSVIRFDFQSGRQPLNPAERQSVVRPDEGLPPALNSSPDAAMAGREDGQSLRSDYPLDYLFKARSQSVVTSAGWALAVALAYAIFLLYRLIAFWLAWLRAKSFRQSGREREPSERIAALVLRCQDAFGLKRVPLMFSAKATTSATVGAWKPVVILPESFCQTSDETLTTMLGYEMAHVARRDYAFNLIYEVLCLSISFHPLATYIKRQIDRTRELACDEMVTERLLERIAYARALLMVAGTLVSPAHQALSLGVFDGDILEERS